MAVTRTSRPERPANDKGFAADSVGVLSMVSLGLASAAPAYSITVTLGLVVLTVGNLAPAALLIGFIPIVCTAFAFRELNRALPDCGTNFVWITRTFGPWAGWIFGNWIPQIATWIAMTVLAQVGASNLLALAGWEQAPTTAVTLLGCLLIALTTAVAYRGIEISAHVQTAMVGVQLIAMVAFGITAFTHTPAADFSPAWLNPFAFPDSTSFAEAALLCLFIYWGWDAALTVNEEARDRTRAPGTAAVVSTVVLLSTYLFTAVAAVSFAGTGTAGLGLGNEANATDVFAALGPALGGPISTLLRVAVCLSAVAALLTCAVASARPTVSVAVHGALPAAFARVHPRFRTPTVSTVLTGAAGIGMLAVLTWAAPAFLGDAVLSVGLLICAYYSATAFACVWYFRRELRSPMALLSKCLLPLLGGLMMTAAFARSVVDMIAPDYGSTSLNGVGGVFLLGIGAIVLGLPITALIRLYFPRFFREGRRSVAQTLVSDDSILRSGLADPDEPPTHLTESPTS
ncbi:APC family permease [Streptomyces sp. NBC_01280]|uniref:APC family permease n=1 Tax=Streptomyces sp. NBC_01280 TaxID=2903810 RepID=UPI002E2FEB93|nr:APC family permease [Streptomyces sp. NBC_01280]